MSGWLQKIMTIQKKPASKFVPSLKGKNNHIQLIPGIPNASVIYGIGASLLFIASFSLLLSGRWFISFLVLFIGGCLFGFAYYFLKYRE